MSRPPKKIYFVTGSDEATVKSTALNVANSLVPSLDPLVREIIDGAAETTEEAVQRVLTTIQALLTFPFLQEIKLVWLKNASMLAEKSSSEALSAALEKLLRVLEEGLPNGILFLVSAPRADKRRTFYKTLSKLASVTVCDQPDRSSTDANIIDWLKQIGARHSLSFEPAALTLLAAQIGVDSQQAEVEFQKLACMDPYVTETMVRELVPSTRESGIFDLSNALLARNIRLCLNSLQQLVFQGERAIGILLVAIVPTIRNLLLAKDLMERYKIRPPAHAGALTHSLTRLPAENTSHLPRKKDGTVNTYALGLAATNATRYSLPELKLAFAECLETNRLLLSTSLDEVSILTRLLIRIVEYQPTL